MISVINGLHENILGIHADESLTSEDFNTILIPALVEKSGAFKKIRMIFHFETSFTGIDLSGMANDAQAGLSYLDKWDRIAFVTENSGIINMVKLLSCMIPCVIMIYNNTDIEAAKTWIEEENESHHTLTDIFENLISTKALNENFPLSGGVTE